MSFCIHATLETQVDSVPPLQMNELENPPGHRFNNQTAQMLKSPTAMSVSSFLRGHLSFPNSTTRSLVPAGIRQWNTHSESLPWQLQLSAQGIKTRVREEMSEAEKQHRVGSSHGMNNRREYVFLLSFSSIWGVCFLRGIKNTLLDDLKKKWHKERLVCDRNTLFSRVGWLIIAFIEQLLCARYSI